MGKQSAGVLLYRKNGGALEVLLVHPGGPFWASRDAGAWSISKGEFEPGEDPKVAAFRELAEETGWRPNGETIALEPIRQAGGKTVLAWALEADVDPASLRSNTFFMEWPPRSGVRKAFPEVDRAGWFPMETARQKILAGQIPLLDQLEQKMNA